MLTVIFFTLITGIIMTTIIYDGEPLTVMLILMSMILGAEIGIAIAFGIGNLSNEQNSTIIYTENLNLNPHNNIYIKIENEKYLSHTSINSITSYKYNTVIEFNNNVTPCVEIKHTNPSAIIKLFGLSPTTEYYYFTIPENGVI